MKKILLSCVTCLLALGLVTACDNEEEDVTPEDPNAGVVEPGENDGGSTDGGGGSAKEIVFGFEVDGVMNYIDGGTAPNYSYEGTLTTDLAKAVRITLEESDTEGAYYVSFDNGGTTNWITITTGNYTNLSYSTEKALLYYNAEYECWGNETLDYFLCCNTTFGCLYCSGIASWISSSPIATLYYTDGSVVSGLKGYTYNAPAPTEINISGLSYVLVAGTTQLTASVNAGANSSVVWSIAGPEGVATDAATVSETGLVSGVSAAEGLVVTATSAVDTSISDDFTINVIEVVLPVTTGDDEADTTYKLGALDTNDYVYRWFTGETTGSTYLLAGDSYDEAADIYMTEQTIPGISSAYTLSLVKEDESLVYISNNGSSTSVTLSSSPCIWVWNAELAVYAQGTESGRSLVLYTSRVEDEETQVETVTYSFRAYAQTDTNLAYPHAALYETEAKVADIETITVSAEDDATSVEVGKTLQLTATVSPEDADPRVTWSVGESDEQYATVDENGLVTGVAVCDSVTITATSVANPSITGTINIAVTEIVPLPEGMIGYFDFTGCTAKGTTISASTDLDTYWVSDMEGIYLGARQYDVVYLGSDGEAAPSDSTECIKFGTSSANGTLQLKFALGTSITQVVLTASGWATKSSGVSSADLTINGVTEACSTSGEPGELTYDITDDWTNLLTISASPRATVHSIIIYGTYSDEFSTPTEIAISAEGIEEPLNIGESVDVSVSWTEGTLFDIDTLVWESSSVSVATVNQTADGATIHTVGEGEAQITAGTEEDPLTSNSLTIKVVDILEESETFVASTLGYENEEEVKEIDGHQIAITFAAGNGNSGSAKYYTSGTAIRVYANNTITFTPTYEDKGVKISTIEIICNGTYYGNDYMTFTDVNGNDAGTLNNPRQSGCTITLTPNVDGAVTLTNWVNVDHTSASGGTQLRIVSITINYTLTDN